MKWCKRCASEFEETESECPDCKGIVEHIPDIKVKLVAKVEVKKDTKGK